MNSDSVRDGEGEKMLPLKIARKKEHGGRRGRELAGRDINRISEGEFPQTGNPPGTLSTHIHTHAHSH